MAERNDLDKLRERIDAVDGSMMELLEERLKISEEIASYKQENNLPVHDEDREREKLSSVSKNVSDKYRAYSKKLYSTLAELSRERQNSVNSEELGAGCRYALIGKKTGHSLSAKLHGMCAEYEYELVDVADEIALEALLKDESYDGFNVTNPYKQVVMKYLDEVSELAKEVDAVNTVKRLPDGRLAGYNTDVYGFKFLVTRNVSGKKALILGTGGGARAAAKALADFGAKPVIYVSREPAKAIKRMPEGSIIIGYEDVIKHKDLKILVNATPVGMYPNISESPLDDLRFNSKVFKELELAIDLVYNPFRTKFLQEIDRLSGKENLPIINQMLGQLRVSTLSGIDMLVRQALLARQIWTSENLSNVEVRDEEALDIKRRLLDDQLNIIMVGMPGSGKSSISKRLAKELDRPYIDIDKKTEELLGDRIENVPLDDPDAMEHFRDMETMALEQNCKLSGCVIATGGGSVLRPQNRDYIKCNSIVVFLRRPTSQLSLKHRPLSQREGVDKLYKERVGIYKRLADVSVGNENTFGNSFDKNGAQNSYMYDIKRFAFKIKRKVGEFLDEVVDYQWSQYELAWRKRARTVRKEDVSGPSELHTGE